MNLPFNFKENPKQAAVIAVLVGIAVLYVYARFILMPQISGAGKAISNAGRLSAEVITAEKNIAKIPGLKKQIESYRSKIESYERMLPAEQEIPKLLENLSTMARNANIKIVGITPMSATQVESPEKIYQEIPILINARSGYHELGKFLSNLESSDRFMKVVDIDIKGNSLNPKRHDVEVLVLTYVLLEGK